MGDFDKKGIASRIRALLSAQGGADYTAAAARLCVDVTSLRVSVDENFPYPTIDVIAAVVRTHGVDPCWLLTGFYDAATHQRALDATTQEMPILLSKMLGSSVDSGRAAQANDKKLSSLI